MMRDWTNDGEEWKQRPEPKEPPPSLLQQACDGYRQETQAERGERDRRQLQALQNLFSYGQQAQYGEVPKAPPKAKKRKPCPRHSSAHPYESLDHFLFQPDLHWNGKVTDV